MGVACIGTILSSRRIKNINTLDAPYKIREHHISLSLVCLFSGAITDSGYTAPNV
jgi:hypothetical protein